MTAEYRIITDREFDLLWDRNEQSDPGEPLWPIWRQRFRQRIDLGQAVTFGVILEGDPVGEGTLELNTGKDSRLCNGKDTAYLAALRIRKEFEGLGHISRLVRVMENHGKILGFSRLTIGVEEENLRNRAIYRHWGFREFLFREEGVLYYAKDIKKQ